MEIGNLDQRICDLIQTNNGNIIASFTRGFIFVFKLNSTSYELIQKIKAHDDACDVEKTIEIKDGRLISCSNDNTIKIWKYNNNKYTLENILRAKKSKKVLDKRRERRFLFDICCHLGRTNEYDIYYDVDDILELNNNIIVSIPNVNGPIIFWNIKELQMECKFKGICRDRGNILKKLSNKLFIVGGVKYIYLFSILNYKLINKIEINYKCSNICCLSDGNILTGHEDGIIRQYNLINNELKLIGEKKYHSDWIITILQLKKDLIISTSYDKKIKLFQIYK